MYRTLWRWHFYAGLFVIPFVLLLAISGTVFLFKPQVERWEERAFLQQSSGEAIAPSAQVAAALAAFPGASLHSYRLPASSGDVVLVHVAMPDGGMRDVFVTPEGRVAGHLDAGTRIAEVARRLHSQLLIGPGASWLVELAACWALVMVVTGLYLWWPRGRGVAGVLWPRRGAFLRDLHAVTGFWVAAFAMLLLLTGLPWTDVWGKAFGAVRAEFGWVKGAPQWNTSGAPAAVPAAHAGHDHDDTHDAMHAGHVASADLTLLDTLVARGSEQALAWPALLLAPGAALFGPPSGHWTLTSATQNRPLGVTVVYDAQTGAELSRETFAERHPVDRVIGYGLAWHEGALFGVINQVIGVFTALALVTMSITGFLMWRRRRPEGVLGAPPLPTGRRARVVTVVMLVMAAVLPLLAASLVLLWLLDRLLPRVSPAAAAWLGMAARPRHTLAPMLLICALTAFSPSPPARAGEPAEETLLPVTVTAERVHTGLAAERSATPGAVTLLDSTSLQERSVTQLADLLRYVPGVWAQSPDGSDEVFYTSRGSNLDATDYDRNGVKFLQDGLPVTAADGNNHNRALDPMQARYVTVAHGANALAYGASTLGGAVDFTTATARNSAPVTASLSGGSFGTWGARASWGSVEGAFDTLWTAETLQREGYRAHSSQDRRSLHGNLGWQVGDRLDTRLHFTWSDYQVELPRALDAASVQQDPWQARADALSGDHGKQVKTWRLAARGTLAEMAGGTLELGASSEHQSLYHPIVSGPFFSLLIDTDHSDSGAMLRFLRSAGAHELAFGLNYGISRVTGGNYENDAGSRGALLWRTNDDAATLELFALDRWKFAPRWTLVYGAQLIDARRDAGGTQADYQAVNPRLGLIRDFGAGTQWYASASRVFEAPTTYELVDEFTGGAGALDAMHGIALETGLRGSAQQPVARYTWALSGYYTALRDEILSIDDPDAPGTGLSANIPRTLHAGIEALLGTSIAIGNGHRIEPLISATFNAFSFDADQRYGNRRLPAAPRWFVRGEGMFRHRSGFLAGPTFDFVGPRYADFMNTYRSGAYGLLGARAGFTSERWQVHAEVRNLLDRRHIATLLVTEQAGPDAQVLFPGAPRSVHVGVRGVF